MSSFCPNLPPLGNPKSHHHDLKSTRIQNSNLQCSMISPYPNCLVHLKPCNHFTPLTLPPLYFGFRLRNPWKMKENEMKVFCNLLSICLLHYNLCNLNLFSNQWLCTHMWFYNSDLLFHELNFWFYFHGMYLGYLFFCCWNSFHLFLFLNYLWFFLFLAPPYEVLWFFNLYFLLLSYFFYEVLWFLILYFLLLNFLLGHALASSSLFNASMVTQTSTFCFNFYSFVACDFICVVLTFNSLFSSCSFYMSTLIFCS